jgi:plastocyanin
VTSRTGLPGIFLTATVLALGGCGGGGSTESKPSAASQATASATSTPRPAHASPTVRIAAFAYKPKRLTVRVGETVSWTNGDSANHTVTGDKGTFSLDNLDHGQTKRFAFREAGTFAYHCEYHPFMHGTVVVKPG